MSFYSNVMPKRFGAGAVLSIQRSDVKKIYPCLCPGCTKLVTKDQIYCNEFCEQKAFRLRRVSSV